MKKILFVILLCFTLPHQSFSAQVRTLSIKFIFTNSTTQPKKVSGFRLYKEGTQVCVTNDSSATEMICQIYTEDGTFDFTLTALYSDNSESLPSPTFQMSIESAGDGTNPSSPDGGGLPPSELDSFLDNGDTGTSRKGTWSTSTSPNPYGTNSLFSKSVNAEYNYDLGVTGLSQVSLWWTASSGRCTSVPVEIYDGTTLIDTEYVNQRKNGGVWNTIGEYDFSNNGRVVIRSDSSSCSTSADAVGFTIDTSSPDESTLPPDLGSNVFDNGDTGTSRTGTWSKSTSPNFYGTNSLYSKTVGAEYSYDLGVKGLSQVSLWWTTSSARCTSVPVEIYDGTILIDTAYVNQRKNSGTWNTIGEYDFSNNGRVVIRSDSSSCSTSADAVGFTIDTSSSGGSSPPTEPGGNTPPSEPDTSTPAEPDGSIPSPELGSNVLDNGDTGTSRTGTWSTSAGPNPYGTNSLYSKKVGAEYSYEIGIKGLAEISLWWTTASARCTSVPIEIYDGTTLIDIAYVNQRNNGGVWNTIGEYDFSNSARVVIRSDSSSCSTSADAVDFTTDTSSDGSAPSPELGGNVLDNGDTGTSRKGTWSASTGPKPYGTNSLYSKTGGAEYSYDLGVTGLSEISLWWTTASARCTGVPVEIYDGTLLIDTVYINQRQNGGVWNTIGEYDFSNSGRVVIRSDSSSCSTNADAVSFTIDTSSPGGNTPPPDSGSNVFDNGDAETSRTGTWSASTGPNPYGTNSIYSKTAGAKYSYDLGVTGLSEISLWWTTASARCTGVPVEIYDGTLLIDTAYINQRNNGGVWNTIGEYDFSTNGRVVIRSDSSSCSTNADAVKITMVY